MKILDRYIFRQVLQSTLAAMLVLLVLEGVFALLAELQDVDRQYQVIHAISYVLLLVPKKIFQVLPMALLLGGLIGLGGLATSLEITAMRSAGYSRWRIAVGAFGCVVVLSILGMLNAEFIAPPAEQYAVEMRSSLMARNGKQPEEQQGFWAKDQNRFISVERLRYGARLENIYIYEVDENNQITEVHHAREAELEKNNWHMQDVLTVNITPEKLDFSQTTTSVISSLIGADMLKTLASEPGALSMSDLWRFIFYLESNSLNSDQYRLVFWSKLLLPLSNLAMLMVGLPFVFGHMRKSGLGRSTLIGILLGLTFYISNFALGKLVQIYGYFPFVGAFFPSALFLLLGVIVLQRMRG